MTAPTITVFYKCDSCGLNDIGVEVRARSTEAILAWMDGVLGPAVGDDHFRRSPHCTVKKLTPVQNPDERCIQSRWTVRKLTRAQTLAHTEHVARTNIRKKKVGLS